MKLIFECPHCKKRASQESEFKLQDRKFIRLSCGHTVTDKLIGQSKVEIDYTLSDGRELYPFQKAGVEFIKDSNFRCLIADEMGLGKTVQVVSALKNYGDELLPAIIVVKASLKVQWFKELLNGAKLVSQVLDAKEEPLIHKNLKVYITTYDSLRNATWKDKINYKTIVLDECQQIKNHNSKRTNMVRDLISRKGMVEKVDTKFNHKDPKAKRITMIANDLMKYHGVDGRFEFNILTNMKRTYLGLTKCRAAGEGIIKGSINLNSVHVMKDSEDLIIETILHEIAHAITPGAGHRTIWHETAKQIGSTGAEFAYCPGSVDLDDVKETEPAVKYIIATSGTPIKNNASEYFPILNILRPELFFEQSQFIQQWTDSYKSGYGYKVGGLREPAKFKAFTKDFIIRRERKEVLPDLPSIRRGFRYTEMNEEVAKKYKSTLKEFSDYMDRSEDNEQVQSTNILAYMNRMRHLTGYAKIADVISYLEEFLENEPNEKITIFHHHIDVADILESQILEVLKVKALRLKSDMDASERYMITEQFKNSDSKIMIAPTLACGEGINLQFCSHAILMEREWNPANEEQAEGRFSRIGSTADSIEVNYPVAIGSIDELFAEYVEKKRQWVRETLSGAKSDFNDTWSQSQIIKDIAVKLLQSNAESWKNNLAK